MGERFDVIGFDPRGVGASTPRADSFTDASRVTVGPGSASVWARPDPPPGLLRGYDGRPPCSGPQVRGRRVPDPSRDRTVLDVDHPIGIMLI